MAILTTDWRTERRNLQGEETGPVRTLGKGDGRTPLRILLEEGTRTSLSTRDEKVTDRGRLLGMMEERLRRRKINRNAPQRIDITPYELRLKGLFGGGE